MRASTRSSFVFFFLRFARKNRGSVCRHADMHRLSLSNSPSLFRGGNEEETVESRRGEDESRDREEIEEAKRERLGMRICRKDRLVHLIPFVLLLCILLLYIFSYDPTQKGDSKVSDSEQFKHNRGIGNHLVLYSHRSVQQAKKNLATATATASPPLHSYRKRRQTLG
ncbi:uncharacterized protein LOC116253595 [Nymphaea colorata]|nr:uncharacterized protein LOC116253595 [Nymphaea colorata]